MSYKPLKISKNAQKYVQKKIFLPHLWFDKLCNVTKIKKSDQRRKVWSLVFITSFSWLEYVIAQ